MKFASFDHRLLMTIILSPLGWSQGVVATGLSPSDNFNQPPICRTPDGPQKEKAKLSAYLVKYTAKREGLAKLRAQADIQTYVKEVTLPELTRKFSEDKLRAESLAEDLRKSHAQAIDEIKAENPGLIALLRHQFPLSRMGKERLQGKGMDAFYGDMALAFVTRAPTLKDRIKLTDDPADQTNEKRTEAFSFANLITHPYATDRTGKWTHTRPVIGADGSLNDNFLFGSLVLDWRNVDWQGSDDGYWSRQHLDSNSVIGYKPVDFEQGILMNPKNIEKLDDVVEEIAAKPLVRTRMKELTDQLNKKGDEIRNLRGEMDREEFYIRNFQSELKKPSTTSDLSGLKAIDAKAADDYNELRKINSAIADTAELINDLNKCLGKNVMLENTDGHVDLNKIKLSPSH